MNYEDVESVSCSFYPVADDTAALSGGSVDSPEYYVKPINKESMLYTFRYTATLQLCASCSWIDLKDAMLDVVRLLGKEYDSNYSDWKEHPDVESKVDVISIYGREIYPPCRKKRRKSPERWWKLRLSGETVNHKKCAVQ